MTGFLIVVGVIAGIIVLIIAALFAFSLLATFGGVMLAFIGIALMLQPSVGIQVVGAILFLAGLIWSWIVYENWKN